MAGNSSGCSAGAVGAVVGEMAAEYATTTLKMNKTDALAFAKVLSAASGVLTGGGGDNVAAVNVANTTGANAAENNRLLHPAEQKKAKELADKSRGQFTQAEIEEQMRLMGNKATGEKPNSAAVLVGGQAVRDSVSTDPSMPKIIQGDVALEKSGQANLPLQQYIQEQTKDMWIPGTSPYNQSDPSRNDPKTSNKAPDLPTASCANGDTSCITGIGQQQNAPLTQQAREAIADSASMLSRQAGVVAAGATAATAAVSPQFKPIAGSVAIGATAIGVAADAVEQVVKPSLSGATTNAIGTIVQTATEQIPGAKTVAPITNELIEIWKNSGSAKSFQDWMNNGLEGKK